ncbi:MAG: TIGR02391 family protein [Chloroflexi bacterium]|nr:TIGR02391 family protein [Chloroflexota bacterium]
MGEGPSLGLRHLHHETELAHRLFEGDHHQEAVRKAAERYVNRVAELADHPDAQDRQGKGLIERVFSETSPILTLNSHETLDEWTLLDRDAHNGYRFLGVGLALAIRNATTHADEYPLTETEALEWLAFISAMHRRLDGAQQFVPTPETEPDEDK